MMAYVLETDVLTLNESLETPSGDILCVSVLGEITLFRKHVAPLLCLWF